MLDGNVTTTAIHTMRFINKIKYLRKKWIINIPREFETSSTVCLQRETTDFYVLDKTPAFQDARSDTQQISSVLQWNFLNNKATISS